MSILTSLRVKFTGAIQFYCILAGYTKNQKDILINEKRNKKDEFCDIFYFRDDNTSLTMPRQNNSERFSKRPHSIVNTIALSKENQGNKIEI